MAEKEYKGKRSKHTGWIIYYYKPQKDKIYCHTPKIKVLYMPYILDYLYDKLNGKYYERNVHYLTFMLLYRRNK